MYNSIIVRSLAKIWSVLVIWYSHSLLNRFVNYLVKNLSVLSKGSYIMRFFTSNRSLLEESLFYVIYSNVIDFINRFIERIKKWIGENTSTSLIYNKVYKLFNTENNMMKTFFVFFMAFGIGIMANNIIRGYFSGRSYFISIILIVISLVGFVEDVDIRSIFKGSYAFRLVESIFTIDEEVDRWW